MGNFFLLICGRGARAWKARAVLCRKQLESRRKRERCTSRSAGRRLKLVSGPAGSVEHVGKMIRRLCGPMCFGIFQTFKVYDTHLTSRAILFRINVIAIFTSTFNLAWFSYLVWCALFCQIREYICSETIKQDMDAHVLIQFARATGEREKKDTSIDPLLIFCLFRTSPVSFQIISAHEYIIVRTQVPGSHYAVPNYNRLATEFSQMHWNIGNLKFANRSCLLVGWKQSTMNKTPK